MTKVLCGCIAVRQGDMLGSDSEEGYLAACILLEAHDGAHMIKTPSGRYIAWETDWDCPCCDDGEDMCYSYAVLTKEEADTALARGSVLYVS